MITVVADDPEPLRAEIERLFGGNPTLLNGTIRLERPRAHEFIPRLMEAWPGRIDSVTVGKPTLEDVFIRRTGHRFWESDGERDVPGERNPRHSRHSPGKHDSRPALSESGHAR
jgi:hypothetical protein